MADVVTPSSSAALLKLPKRAAVVNASRFSSVKIEFVAHFPGLSLLLNLFVIAISRNQF
jgi:hypothetical protein